MKKFAFATLIVAAIAFAQQRDAKRAAVLDDQMAISDITPTSREAGQKHFEKKCSSCHVYGEIGTSFGPELTKIGTTRTKKDIVQTILFPPKDSEMLPGLVDDLSKEELADLISFLRPPGSVGPGPMPDGPGKAEAMKLCGSCHAPERAQVNQGPEGWDATFNNMITRGMTGTEEEFTKAFDYLVKAFPAPPPSPISINSAEAIDLESLMTLTRTQAAALIKYRTDHGPFKTIEDIKKVPGIDPVKVDSKRERIKF
jgi:competence protein ComEA